MGVEYFEDIGSEAHSPVFGKVALNEKGIRHLIARGITYRKSALLRAVKSVIENGHVLKTDENHNGHPFDTAIVAASVALDGKSYYMGVSIRQEATTRENFYYPRCCYCRKKKRPTLGKQDAGTGTKADSDRDSEAEPSIAILLSQLADYNREFAEAQNSPLSDALTIASQIEFADGERQSSLRDMPADLTREYVANLTADDAINDVEKDAIRICTREEDQCHAARRHFLQNSYMQRKRQSTTLQKRLLNGFEMVMVM